MKLSEAIRLGSVACAQSFGATFTSDGRRCAHGAALLAVGLPNKEYPASMEVWCWTIRTQAICPVCKAASMPFSVIRCLNDNHRWTRSQIADWVETVEPADIEPPSLDSKPVLVEVA